MKNYQNDDEDEYEDDDLFDEDDDDSELEFEEFENAEDVYDHLLQQNAELQAEQIDLMDRELNERLINDALIMNSKHWLWYFHTPEKKMKILKKTYVFLRELIDNNIETLKQPE